MFGPVLKKEGETRICYSTSTSFRFLCISCGFILTYLILKEANPSFILHENIYGLSISLIFILSALYLERTVFDKKSNQFEKHFGLLFLYSKLVRPLDSIECISLNEFNSKRVHSNEFKPSFFSRNYVTLTIITSDKEIFKIDMAKNSATKELLKTAEEISNFCSIPLETKN